MMNVEQSALQLFQQVFGSAMDPMWLVQGGQCTDCNLSALQLLGYRSQADLLPVHWVELSETEQPDGELATIKAERVFQLASTEGPQRFDWVFIRPDGEPLWVEVTLSKFECADDDRFLTAHWRDITHQKKTEEQLHYDSTHDALTGLPNRRALELELVRALKRARQTGKSMAVGMIDLDGFKGVNDDLGHDAGDALLKAFGGRMQRRLRRHDFIARLGGDEFVVLLNQLDAGDPIQDLRLITERLKEVTAQAFQPLLGQRVGIGMSMGVAIYPRDGDDPDSLLRLADHALLAIKAIKLERTDWWALGDAIPEPDPQDISLEPYGRQASELLKEAMPHILDIRSASNRQTGDLLLGERHANHYVHFLWLFTEQETLDYARYQEGRFDRIVHPGLDDREHQIQAERLGELHALLGLEETEMFAALDDYSSLLQPLIKLLPWRFNARLAVMGIIQGRLVHELRGNQAGRSAVLKEHQQALVMLETLIPLWAGSEHKLETLLEYLIQLEAIVAASAGRPSIRGDYLLEHLSGREESTIESLFEWEGAQTMSTHSEQSARWRAWRTGRIETCPNLRGPSLGAQALAERGHPRSLAAIPILDNRGYPSRILTIYGRVPSQFESPGMRFWLESLRQLATDLLEYRQGSQAGELTDWEHRQKVYSLLASHAIRFAVQPLIDFKTGEIDKVEFLARMLDGERLMGPNEFLKTFGPPELEILFEESLDTAIHWLGVWDQSGLKHFKVSINVPVNVLVKPLFADHLEQKLAQAGIARDRIYLELLETQDDVGDSLARDHAIRELGALGVRLVMDDLGSGYSSLTRLRTIPFHTVKIDQNLVKDAAVDPERSVPFIRALVRMAHVLGQQVVVEGLQSIELVEMAAALGAERGQGYAIAKPMLAESFLEWLKTWVWSVDPSRPVTALGVFTQALVERV